MDPYDYFLSEFILNAPISNNTTRVGTELISVIV